MEAVMKRAIRRFGRAVIGLFVVSWLFSFPILSPAQDFEKFFGVVVQADAAHQTLVVRDVRSGKNLQLRVSDLTLIKKENEYKKLPDLVSGTSVVVQYEISEGELIALTVMIQPPGD
jgi:hypothetical protein